MKPCITMTIPLEAQYLYRRGLTLMEQRNEEAALACFRQAVFIAPGFSKAYRELGSCLDRLHRPEEASACYRKAMLVELAGYGPLVAGTTGTRPAGDRTETGPRQAHPVPTASFPNRRRG